LRLTPCRRSSTSDAGLTIGSTVPGDLITDLWRAGVIGDPLYENNFLPYGPDGPGPATPGAPYGRPLWDNSTWTVSTSFDLAFDATGLADLALVFEGVKMAATVSLNGNVLGVVADMFLRYVFNVGALLKPSGNTLSLVFPISSDDANIGGRWDSCSGGWDWSFYSGVRDQPRLCSCKPNAAQSPSSLTSLPPSLRPPTPSTPTCAHFRRVYGAPSTSPASRP